MTLGGVYHDKYQDQNQDHPISLLSDITTASIAILITWYSHKRMESEESGSRPIDVQNFNSIQLFANIYEMKIRIARSVFLNIKTL